MRDSRLKLPLVNYHAIAIHIIWSEIGQGFQESYTTLRHSKIVRECSPPLPLGFTHVFSEASNANLCAKYEMKFNLVITKVVVDKNQITF